MATLSIFTNEVLWDACPVKINSQVSINGKEAIIVVTDGFECLSTQKKLTGVILSRVSDCVFLLKSYETDEDIEHGSPAIVGAYRKRTCAN